jgi:hypothetical protein
MVKVWIICAMVVSLAGFALPAIAQDQNVAGTWTGTFTRTAKSGSNRIEGFTLVLKQDGEAVTGTMTSKILQGGKRSNMGRERVLRVKGTLTRDKLSLKIGRQRWLQGTVSGDSMTGKSGSGNLPPLDFTATRGK